jgi:hypothetical protein
MKEERKEERGKSKRKGKSGRGGVTWDLSVGPNDDVVGFSEAVVQTSKTKIGNHAKMVSSRCVHISDLK